MYNGWLGSYPLFFYITPTLPPTLTTTYQTQKPAILCHSFHQKKEKVHTHMYDFTNKNPDFKINTKKLLLNTI